MNTIDRSPQQQLIQRIRENFPAELLGKRIWTLWQFETKSGSDKPTKVPYSPRPDGTIGAASSINPDTWATFEDVCTALLTKTDGKDDCGIGCFNDGTYAFVDLDDCIDADGQIEPWASTLIERLDTYCELSPSGRGAHLFLRGSIIGDGKKINGVEMYCRARYFTVTGSPTSTALPVRDALADELETLRGEIEANALRPYQKSGTARAASAANSGPGIFAYKSLTTEEREAKLARGLADNLSDYGDDRSAAVHGVLQLLARKHGGDADKMIDQFEASALCAAWGSKWDRLRENEIGKAVREWEKNGKPSWETETVHPHQANALTFTKPKVPGKMYDYVLQGIGGKKNGWFPRGRIHQIAGGSGAGKTTLILNALRAQHRREYFLSHLGNGLEWCVVFADRGQLANEETLDRLGMLTERDRIDYLGVCWDGEAAVELCKKIEARNPMPEVVFVEGADMLVSAPNKMEVVAPFLSKLQKIAEHYHVALILSVGSGKTKRGEGYVVARDRGYGSVAFPRMCDMTLDLTYAGDEADKGRKLSVSHRQAAAETFDLEFNALGLLVPAKNRSDVSPVEEWAEAYGGSFTRVEAVAGLNQDEAGLSKTQVYEHIKRLVKAGRLIESKRDTDGKYVLTLNQQVATA